MLRMVGNRWLWSIMLGNANEARNSRVGYSRLPTEFLILKTQLQATMIVVGISKCTQHVCESGRNSSHLRWQPTLSRLSLAFPCIPDDSVRLCNWLLFEFWKQTHTHIHTHTRAGDNLQYNISTEWNILKGAHDFLKCMLCLAYPTIILELKSNKFFGTHGHKERFYFSKVCSD